MAAEDVWILGIHMTKFGKHPDKDTVDLAAVIEAALEEAGLPPGVINFVPGDARLRFDLPGPGVDPRGVSRGC